MIMFVSNKQNCAIYKRFILLTEELSTKRVWKNIYFSLSKPHKSNLTCQIFPKVIIDLVILLLTHCKWKIEHFQNIDTVLETLCWVQNKLPPLIQLNEEKFVHFKACDFLNFDQVCIIMYLTLRRLNIIMYLGQISRTFKFIHLFSRFCITLRSSGTA